ncbi:GHKL domain-containing protein [Lactobacillus mulieris]|uniref:sensor histidine kinase n=1 Tax=Lactobacillus mulieris TaxID=2508708 RepID=UPI001432AA3E|nr:GHKL domain-containing protein [Lactobacillus mulieris]MCF1783089.1 GHKL domain-containing protein [Lactobacillus mulieris]MCW8104634.1 GHKL domain-containing protein [Lactobacillus mulieris]MDK6804014.1 GHKL domain-containing protein [Lactobacillus mulieris]MDK8383147.1 GHKL domain-containing protein [Lactobacillus mulieris]MDT9621350.1 GHKL domain-containing protein [Lactobacillus mulieris]
MVFVDSFSYFLKELFNMLLFFVMIKLLTNIREKNFYFALLIFIFPLTLLSVTDTLLTGIALISLIVILRFKSWRKKPEVKFTELLGILISLTIYGIVPFFSSIIVANVFKLEFNVLNERGPLLVVILIGFDWILAIIIALTIKSKVMKESTPSEEAKVYCMQLGIFLTFVYLFGEVLRKMQVLGIFQSLMIAFLVAQFAVTTHFTYLTLKKNHEKTELCSLKEQMEMMRVYTAEIEKNYQELRKFRHDYKNMLLGLKVMQTESVIDERYLNKMIDYSHRMIDNSVMRFSGLSNLKIDSVKSLMIAKLVHAEQSGIEVNFECLTPITNINMDEIKLVRILGILIDNAVEAAIESEEKRINILFIDFTDLIEISIENSFLGKLPSLSEMKKVGFSKKGKNRGLGLSNAQDILLATKQADLAQYSNQGIFVSTLTIRKSE